MISHHPLQGALDRIDWAEKRMADLKGQIHAYGKRYADAVTVQPDAQQATGFRAIYPSAAVSAIPTQISILVGEVIYNLRAALDYLAFELALLDSGRVQDFTQFPVCDSPEKFAKKRASDLKGFNQIHVATIEALQPYRGCDWTRRLQEISNPDKHQRLTERGSSVAVEVMMPGYTYRASDPAQNLFVTKRVAKGADGVEVDVQLVTSVIVSIPIKHSGMVIGQPVEELLHKIQAGARHAIESFAGDFDGVHKPPHE